MDDKELEQTKELENVNEVMKDSTLANPDLTFCEKTTYFDFLLSNAKDKEEEKEIKKTINDYLDLYEDNNKSENE